jgi:3-oxoadipate enol-lactonase / 4-carboxymuconolactone decarboxylase
MNTWDQRRSSFAASRDAGNDMPFLTLKDARHFYRLEGRHGHPFLVLSHSLGTDHSMWELQMPDLLRYFQVLRYDIRGHGASDSSCGEYSVEQLGRDVLAITDQLGMAKFAWCGLSMGGAVGQWIALNAPHRITDLILSNTSPRFGDLASWASRIQSVREGGMAAIVDVVLKRFFSARTNPAYATSVRAVFLATDPIGYLGCCGALRDFDSRPLLEKISSPCLVIGSKTDPSTPWHGHGALLAHAIPNAKAILLPGAHLSNLEQPRSFTAALLDFLLRREPQSFEAGLEKRRTVLGDEHVDRAISGTTDLNRDFQELITRYAWGEIWSRPLFDDRMRRLLVLSLMASLGRWDEFRMHLRSGFEHELEDCEVQEILLLVAIYAGVPAANTAFHLAQEEIGRRQNE